MVAAIKSGAAGGNPIDPQVAGFLRSASAASDELIEALTEWLRCIK
jgi:hypothetical protein